MLGLDAFVAGFSLHGAQRDQQNGETISNFGLHFKNSCAIFFKNGHITLRKIQTLTRRLPGWWIQMEFFLLPESGHPRCGIRLEPNSVENSCFDKALFGWEMPRLVHCMSKFLCETRGMLL